MCAQRDEYEYLPPQLSRSVYRKEMAPVHLKSIFNRASILKIKESERTTLNFEFVLCSLFACMTRNSHKKEK